MISIKQAERHQAATIASLIMEAMNHECCQNLAGSDHTLDDFRQMMTSLVEMDDSQYSYRNTLVAIDRPETSAADDGSADKIAGIAVMYDGGQLHQLRRRFIEAAREAFGIDYSSMQDETAAGELYLDSLCVAAAYRRQGIATRLLKAAFQRAQDMGLPCVGLLVDKGNPKAERLYTSAGFEYVDDTTWGGHEMRHLQMVNCNA